GQPGRLSDGIKGSGTIPVKGMIPGRELQIDRPTAAVARPIRTAGRLRPGSGPTGVNRGSFEYVRVGTRAAQLQLAGFFAVDQDPVGLDVTVAPPLPIAAEGMIPVLRVQPAMGAQRLDDRAELLHVLAALLE